MKLVLDMRGGSVLRSALVVAVALLGYCIVPRSRKHYARKVWVARDVHILLDKGHAEAVAAVAANMAWFALVRVTQGLRRISVPGSDLLDSWQEMWFGEYTPVRCDEVEEVEWVAGLIYNLVSGSHGLHFGQDNGSDEVGLCGFGMRPDCTPGMSVSCKT